MDAQEELRESTMERAVKKTYDALLKENVIGLARDDAVVMVPPEHPLTTSGVEPSVSYWRTDESSQASTIFVCCQKVTERSSTSRPAEPEEVGWFLLRGE